MVTDTFENEQAFSETGSLQTSLYQIFMGRGVIQELQLVCWGLKRLMVMYVVQQLVLKLHGCLPQLLQGGHSHRAVTGTFVISFVCSLPWLAAGKGLVRG